MSDTIEKGCPFDEPLKPLTYVNTPYVKDALETLETLKPASGYINLSAAKDAKPLRQRPVRCPICNGALSTIKKATGEIAACSDSFCHFNL